MFSSNLFLYELEQRRTDHAKFSSASLLFGGRDWCFNFNCSGRNKSPLGTPMDNCCSGWKAIKIEVFKILITMEFIINRRIKTKNLLLLYATNEIVE